MRIRVVVTCLASIVAPTGPATLSLGQFSIDGTVAYEEGLALQRQAMISLKALQ